MQTTEVDLIAAHIAHHGVTRCPAAIVAPTTVELRPEDVEAHRTRVAPITLDRANWQPAADKRRGNRR